MNVEIVKQQSLLTIDVGHRVIKLLATMYTAIVKRRRYDSSESLDSSYLVNCSHKPVAKKISAKNCGLRGSMDSSGTLN